MRSRFGNKTVALLGAECGSKSGLYGGEFFYQAFTQQQYPFDTAGLAVNTGHDHEDAGTFYLYWGGVDLALEMADCYSSWGVLPDVGQTAHNTLLVDGAGQYWPVQLRWIRGTRSTPTGAR